MTIKLSRLLLCLCLAASLAGCDLVGGEQTPEELVPLAVGNYWSYQLTYGGIVDSFTVSVTDEVETTHEGKSYRAYGQRLRFSSWPEPTPYAWLYANGPEGLYAMGGVAETDTLAIRSLRRKYPARVGERWPAVRLSFRLSSTQDFYVRDSLETTLVATDEVLETPAGRFRCYVYKYSFLPADDVAEEWDVYEYHAPGIGMVGEILRGQDDGRLLQQVLLFKYQVQ